MSDLKNELKKILLKYSYEQREVTLASGKKSNFYFDGKQTTLHPMGAYLVGELMYELIVKEFPEATAVGGPTLGADPIAASIAVVSAKKNKMLNAFIVRKEPKGHGTGAWIEGIKHLSPGQSVVLVEDVITSGGSILKAAAKVKDFGLKIAGAVVIVDREEGGKEAMGDIELRSLFTKTELLQLND